MFEYMSWAKSTLQKETHDTQTNKISKLYYGILKFKEIIVVGMYYNILQ